MNSKSHGKAWPLPASRHVVVEGQFVLEAAMDVDVPPLGSLPPCLQEVVGPDAGFDVRDRLRQLPRMMQLLGGLVCTCCLWFSMFFWRIYVNVNAIAYNIHIYIYFFLQILFFF